MNKQLFVFSAAGLSLLSAVALYLNQGRHVASDNVASPKNGLADSKFAQYEKIVAIDSNGVEHTVSPQGNYLQVQSSSPPSGSFKVDLGGPYYDRIRFIQYAWILVPAGNSSRVASNPTHYQWLDPAITTWLPNWCPSNSASVSPTVGMQVGTAMLSQENISTAYSAPVFTNIATMPRNPKPARYYSFKANKFYNLSSNGTYVADPNQPTLQEVCARNGVQADCPWVPSPYNMGGSSSVCPHLIYVRTLSPTYFEIRDNCMNVGPFSNRLAYANIFRYLKPTTTSTMEQMPVVVPPSAPAPSPPPPPSLQMGPH